MKSIFKINTLALSVAALCVAPAAFSQEGNLSGSANINLEEKVYIDLKNQADVHLIKKSLVVKQVDIMGTITTTGTIEVTGAALGIIDDKQINIANTVSNDSVRNDAHISEGAGGTASGNIGVNVAAGDDNLQDNATALAAADAAGIFGSADAESFTAQLSGGNYVTNVDIVNSASVDGGSFNGASGVIALNVTAGNFNMQKNNTVAAVSTGSMAEANIWVKQEAVGHQTENTGKHLVVTDITTTTIPDRFNQFDPVIVVEQDETEIFLPVINTAMLSNALIGATGNIGANISAGTNNQQANSLAISASTLDVAGF